MERLREHGESRAVRIMEEGLFRCHEDMNVCVCATCCPLCLQGNNMSYFGEACFSSCLVCPWTIGCQTSILNDTFQAEDKGWAWNWCLSFIFPCCTIARNTRAVNAWLKEKYPTENSLNKTPVV